MYLWNKVEKHLLLHLYETSPFHTCHFSLPTFARLGGSEVRSHSGGMSRPRWFPLRWAVLRPVRTACRIPVFRLIQTIASWPAKRLNQRRPSFPVPLEWWESLGSLKKLRKGVPGRVQLTCDPSTKRQPRLGHGFFAVFFLCIWDGVRYSVLELLPSMVYIEIFPRKYSWGTKCDFVFVVGCLVSCTVVCLSNPLCRMFRLFSNFVAW